MKRYAILVALAIMASISLAQQNNKTVQLAPPRPKVGIVLGGGGAKGAAHIGVLKYLEELGIPVDYVAGTSMGAIIGGLYAMGYSPDELAQLIAEMNWSQYVGNSIDRSAMSQCIRKRYSTSAINIPFSLDGVINTNRQHPAVSIMPSAFVNNTALINLFNSLCVGYQKDMDFNDLPIPFACVATDINTGEEVIIRNGSVPTAMRASMAIPGVFSPVNMNGLMLVDGGLVNNFPADVVQEMGADIIIGVDVPDKNDINEDAAISLPEVFVRLIDNAISTKREENRERCSIYMMPDISGYGTLSFSHDAIDTLVNRGYKKAKDFHIPLLKIKQYLDSVNGEPLNKQLRATKARNLADEPVFISSIVFNHKGTSGQSFQKNWLLHKSGLKIGSFMSEQDINRAVDLYRGTGAFNDITYILNENDTVGSYTLTMNFKPTQPHIVGLGIRYDTEEGAAMHINLGINEKKLSGFKMNLIGRLSYNPRFNITSTYSMLNLADFNLTYEYINQHYRQLHDNGSYSNLNYVQHKTSVYATQLQRINWHMALGATFTSTFFGKAGIFDDDHDSQATNTTLNANRIDNHLFSPFVYINYDNRDAEYFALHGINTTLKTHINFDIGTGGSSYEDLSFSILGYITPGNKRFTIIPKLYSRYVIGYPFYANLLNTVGGDIAERHSEYQMPFIGINHIDEVPDWATIACCDIRYNFYGKHYVTASYNYLYGITPYGNPDGSHSYKRYSGLGIRYSYNSFIGPITLTGQWSDYTNKFSVYSSIGYIF